MIRTAVILPATLAATLATTLALSACQLPPERTPSAAERGVPAAYLVAGPVDLTLPGADGAALPARLWRASAPPRGVILALHGFTDSRDGWQFAAPALARAGYSVYAPDQRGFGAAPGRGQWPGDAALVADARAMITAIASREPGRRLFVIGESMGGGEVQILAADPPPGVAGFVALAPAVWTSRQMGPGLTVPLALANALAPDWRPDPHRFGVGRVVTDNCNALLRLSYDPLTLHGAPIADLHGVVQLMNRAAAAAPHVRAPLLVAYGAHDHLVPPEAMRANWAALPEWVRRAYYPSGYHLLPDDLNRQAVIGDMVSWMNAPDDALPSGADVYASTFPTVSAGDDASVPLWSRLGNLPGRSGAGAKPAPCRYDPRLDAQ